MLFLTVAFVSETKPYFTPGDFLNVRLPHVLEPVPLFINLKISERSEEKRDDAPDLPTGTGG